MADENTTSKRGEALWKAELDAVNVRNDAARRRANEVKSPSEESAIKRAQHADVAEAAMLKKLNARIETERRGRA